MKRDDRQGFIDFFNCLHEGQLTAFTQIKKTGERVFISTETFLDKNDAIRWVERRASANHYFHVGTLKKEISKKASKRDIANLSVLWADIDIADIMKKESLTYVQAKNVLFKKKLPAIYKTFKPTIMACSGNGLHLYWKLKKSVDCAVGESLNKKIATVLGSDKSVTDCSRIMAVPGTIKFQDKSKIAKGYPNEVLKTFVIQIDSERRFDERLFDTYIQESNLKRVSTDPRVKAISDESKNAYAYESENDYEFKRTQYSTDPAVRKFHSQLSKSELEKKLSTSEKSDKVMFTYCKQAWNGYLRDHPRVEQDTNKASIRDLVDHSSVDLSVCNHLAYYFQGNFVWIDRMFRAMPRCRSKWDSIHTSDGLTYGQMTIAKAVSRRDDYLPPPAESTITKYNEMYAVVDVEGVVHVAKKHFGTNGEPLLILYKVNAFRNKTLNEFACDENGAPILTKGGSSVLAANYWLGHPKRRTYERAAFLPRKDMLYSTVFENSKTLNLYLGTMFSPVEGNPINLILKHILEVWCKGNEALNLYVLSWLAQLIQYPGEQAASAIVLMSEQGAGKNIITDIFSTYFGAHALVATKTDDIVGRFNDQLALSVFVLLNEATFGGSKQEQGAIKAIITDDTILCERKFGNKFRVDNCTHLIFSSNEDFPVAIESSDRRFVVLDLDNKYKNDSDYFKPLVKEINLGGQESFIDYLLKFDLSGFDTRMLPATSDDTLKMDIKRRTLPPVESWWDEVIFTRAIIFTENTFEVNVIDAASWVSNSVTRVSVRNLHKAMIVFLVKTNKRRAIPSSATFSTFLTNKLGFVLSDTNEDVMIDVPDYRQCEREWKVYMGAGTNAL